MDAGTAATVGAASGAVGGIIVGMIVVACVHGKTHRRNATQTLADFLILMTQLRNKGRDLRRLDGLNTEAPLPSEKFLALYTICQWHVKPLIRKIERTNNYNVMEMRRQAAGSLIIGTSTLRYTEIERAECEVEAYWIKAPGVQDNAPIALVFFGGGFVGGHALNERGAYSRFSKGLNMRVLSTQYRVGPENPLPAGVDDCVSTYKWLLAGGVNPKSICLIGGSAGGGR